MSSVVAAKFGVADGDLNKIGRRRTTEGVLCFVHPGDGLVEAVCVDFGLSVRAKTAEEARQELALVITDALTVARDGGFLTEFLNQPDNSAAAKQQRQWELAFRLISAIVAPIWRARKFTKALFQEYNESVLPHSFA